MPKPLTKSGYARMCTELDYLWKKIRPQVVERISIAAAEGDRSENAEYIYGKKRLRELDKRIRYLSKLLDDVQVVDVGSLSGEVARFGATVVCLDGQLVSKEFTIVGEGEAQPEIGTISYRAPIARALMGKTVGDEVVVPTPGGTVELEIDRVYFDARNCGSSEWIPTSDS